jgi:pullulanase-type alpha-1,6-glucosidase
MTRSLADLGTRGFWLACALALGACSNSTDDREPSGGGVTEQAPVTVTANFSAAGTTPVVVGAPPLSAQFTGGTIPGNGRWVIAEGQTATVDFTTPAEQVTFATVPGASGSAPGVASKLGPGGPVGSQAVSPPFDVPMFVRGTVRDDWAASGRNRLREVSDNVLAVTMALEPGDSLFKIADADWGQNNGGLTNCGAFGAVTPVAIGVPFTLSCETLSQNLALTIAEAGDYTFTFNAAAKTVTVAPPDDGGGGGGGEEPEPVIKVRVIDTAGDAAEFEDLTGALEIEETRRGSEKRIARIEILNLGGAGNIGVEDFSWIARPEFAPSAVTTSIYYRNATGNYANTTITVGGQTRACAPEATFGCRVTGVSVLPYTQLTYTVNDAGRTQTITAFPGAGTQGLYTFQGSAAARVGAPAGLPKRADEVILYYYRPDGEYDGWGLHLFPVQPASEAWTKFPTPGEYLREGIDPVYGAYFRIGLPQNTKPAYSNNPANVAAFPEVLGFIIHKGDTKDPGPDQFIRIANGNIVFVVSEVNDVSTVPPGASSLRIGGAAAHWVNASTILWTPPAGVTQVRLLASMDASIKAGVQGLDGAFDSYTLSSTSKPTLPNQKHLSALSAWALPAAAVAEAKELARMQLVAMGYDSDGEPVAGTLVQIPGALDALYGGAAQGASLGVTYSGSAPSLAVWAPTALVDPGVTVRVYEADGTLVTEAPMDLDEDSGVWSVTGSSAWNRRFYTINLRVYSPAVDGIVTNEVTDPYSVSLSTDSLRSQFVNLDDADLEPAGWDTLVKPDLEAPEDIVIYELHVRDFSIADASVPAGDRGKFTAFDVPGTRGRQHLEALADAGLTHVHLLPAFDIATVKENPADRVELDDPVEDLCAASSAAASLCATDAGKTIRRAMQDAVAAGQLDRPQQITGWLKSLDGFNWGYDPLHFGVPEGSYSTDPNGPRRILEFRRMVQGLADAGLGTIMDVVYNHTNASGQSPKSVLDRIVPGYYHRRDQNTGNVLKNSCCDDTAPEFRMMEKLVTDTGVRFVRDYKVDGFRFDLMSFHPKDSMERFQAAVKAVNPDVYVYGEGWNFGAIENDKRFVAARQANLGGTGIGSFSDRIRDPVRGGGPFDSGAAHVKNQGFISGWYYDPNSSNTGSSADREALIKDTDNIRVWMAGGLKNFTFTSAAGTPVKGENVDYRGQKSGYTLDPQEAINYISKHDNETLWDISAYKHPANTPVEERIRAHKVGLSVVLLGQGIPFLHAGSDIIRSKSMDRNSFDSGDWFNELDWTLSDTKWNSGLPPEGDNKPSYTAITDVQLNVNAEPTQAGQQAVFVHVQEMLEVRKSSPLFRLRTGAEIEKRVTFENTGAFQVPGLVAMRIDGCADPSGLTPPLGQGAAMVLINASDDARTLGLYRDETTWALHPVLAASADPVVRTSRHDANGFTVPARTTAVFFRAAQTSCAPYPRELFVRGGFNDWGNPTPTDQYKLVFLGGVDYSVSAPIGTAGTYGFKIADANWTGDTNCGAGAAGGNVRFGVPLTLECFSNSGNLSLTAPEAGNYTFSLNASDTAKPVLTVGRTPLFGPTTVFVRGGFNDWGNGPAPTAPLAWDSVSKYQVVIDNLPAQSFAFKIADNDWGNTNGGLTNCGAGANATVTVGQPYTLVCNTNDNLNITFPTAGSYLFSVDASNPAALQLTVEKTPFDVALFLRGLQNDWTAGAQNRMRYAGGGVYRISKMLGAGADDFKIADNDWGNTTGGATNCGAASPVVIGTPLPIDCSSNSPNINFAPASPGSYVFELTFPQSGTPSLLVTGP